MICPKIKRTVLGGPAEQEEEEVVTGICDYIPLCLKAQQNINISIVGNQIQIVNQILWNEFFAKSLIKEAYYFLMHNYATEGRQTMTAVFAKKDGKVYKIDEIMDWKSALRETLLKEGGEVSQLELEGFTNKGNIKKINIYLSRYPITIDKLHLLLKTDTIEVPKVSKNEFVSEMGNDEFRLLEETDRTNKHQNTSSNCTHKTKYSQISNISLKTKQSIQSKENKQYSSKTPSRASKKADKITNREKSIISNNKEATKTEFEPKSILNSLTPQRHPVNRESVLAKIITSKEEQIILLKEEVDDKTYEYEMMLREQDESHKKEIEKLTKSVKQVLQSYSSSQKEALNENLYLKERLRILEETVEKSNAKLETYASEMGGYVAQVRQLEEANSRLTSTNKKLQEEQDRSRNTQLSELTRLTAQIGGWRDKAEDYRIKYEKIVDMMKNVINFT